MNEDQQDIDFRNDIYTVLIEMELGPLIDHSIDTDCFLIDVERKDELIDDLETPRYKYVSRFGIWVKFAGDDMYKLMSLWKFQKMFMKDMEWMVDDKTMQSRIEQIKTEKEEELLDFSFVYFHTLMVFKDRVGEDDFWFSSIKCLTSEDGIYQVEFYQDDEDPIFTLLEKPKEEEEEEQQ